MIKQTYDIYHRQWQDYFDYATVSLVLPEILLGRWGVSDAVYREMFRGPESKGYFFNFRTCIGFRRDNSCWNVDFLIFGLGFRIVRQWSY